MQSNIQSKTSHDVDQLNSFLRGELSAVETYDQALGKIDDTRLQTSLRDVRESHDRRVDLLRQRIVQLGGEPASSSGIWGGFVKLVEGGAAAFGTSSAIAALEEGEDHGRDDYRADLKELAPETRSFISTSILPEQLRTHQVMSSLKRQLKAAS